jgi:hypothetical protein
MDLGTMAFRVQQGYYSLLSEFIDDFQTMCANCIRYNPAGTPAGDYWHDYAQTMLHTGNAVLEGVAEVAAHAGWCRQSRDTERPTNAPCL